MTRAILAALVLSGVCATSAQAATLTNVAGTLTFDAGPGGSYVSVWHSFDGSDSVVVYSSPDRDPITALTGSDDVTQNPQNGRLYRCAGVRLVALNGGAGEDVLSSNARVPAALAGGLGDDELSGGEAADSLDGGPGEDVLSPGKGDIVKGGTGVDQVSFVLDESEHVNLSLDGQANDGKAAGPFNLMPDVEDIWAFDVQCIDYCDVQPAPLGLTLVGSDSANRLTGSIGDDILTGGGGSDELIGNTGNDTFYARDGVADRIACGPGTDTVIADELDDLGDACENVQVAATAFGLEDKPPTVAWAAGERLLTVNAADDHAVARVQFLDGGRVLCTDTTAPYTCDWQPRVADVGRNTLIAIATDSVGQTATAVRAVTIPRVKAGALTLAFARALARGKLRVPAGVPCAGTVVVKAGRTSRETTLRKDCTYRVRIRAQNGVKVRATYLGTATVQPRRSATVRA
jgi:hypothetical protein